MVPPGVAAIILAAGEGRRMGAGQNKAFLSVGGHAILTWSIEAFSRSDLVDAIVLVVAEQDRSRCDALLHDRDRRKVKEVVTGGTTRQESEWNGLQATRRWIDEDGVVLIHDAARPFFPAAQIGALVAAARGGAILAVPAEATIVSTRDGMVAAFPADLWAAQTPQAFAFWQILQAHDQARARGFRATDTAAIYEWGGGVVTVIAGSADNIKITTPDDLARAELIARRLA